MCKYNLHEILMELEVLRQRSENRHLAGPSFAQRQSDAMREVLQKGHVEL